MRQAPRLSGVLPITRSTFCRRRGPARSLGFLPGAPGVRKDARGPDRRCAANGRGCPSRPCRQSNPHLQPRSRRPKPPEHVLHGLLFRGWSCRLILGRICLAHIRLDRRVRILSGSDAHRAVPIFCGPGHRRIARATRPARDDFQGAQRPTAQGTAPPRSSAWACSGGYLNFLNPARS